MRKWMCVGLISRWLRGLAARPEWRCCSATVFALSALMCTPLLAQAPGESLGEDYAAWFQQQVQDEGLVGAAFVIVDRTGVRQWGTFGHTDVTRTQPVDPDTVFRLASVSKTFAAGLAAQLVKDGELGWEDPVVQYVPDFHIRGDASRIRVKDLLGQSSGLIPHAYDNLIEEGVSQRDIFKRLSELEYFCSPGSCYSYQNSVFSLIEPVVKQATSKSYARLVEQRIFRPLDMRSASVGYRKFLAEENRALPHVKRNGQWKTVDVLPTYYRVSSAAGVNASITDMGKWLLAQLGNNPEILPPEMIITLVTPRVSTPRELHRREWNRLLTDAHYGLGWRVYQLGATQLAYHSGWVMGYRADLAWSAELGLGLAVLLNAETSAINTLSTRFWEMAGLGTVSSVSVAGGK